VVDEDGDPGFSDELERRGDVDVGGSPPTFSSP
jgi:hypothetical protein